MQEFRWKDSLRLVLPPLLVDIYRAVLIRSGYRAPLSALLKLPITPLEKIFPGIGQAEIQIPCSQLSRGPGALPMTEYLFFSAICRYRQPLRVLEIGTFRGSSTLAMAVNSPDRTEVFTLDLDPSHKKPTKYPLNIGGLENHPFAPGELFLQTPYARKIRQLYGDSASFDFQPFYGTMDLVFIDGNHGYENVRSDSEQAFRMLRPGGLILWDDYYDAFPSVVRCLNEIHASRPLLHIERSRLVLYLSA